MINYKELTRRKWPVVFAEAVERAKAAFVYKVTAGSLPELMVFEHGEWFKYGKWRINKFLEDEYPNLTSMQKRKVLARLRSDARKYGVVLEGPI